MKKIIISGLLEKELGSILKDFQIESYRASQIFAWVYKKGIEDFFSMVNLPTSLREALSKIFSISSLRFDKGILSKEDGTEKFLFRLEDGEFIETVSIPTKKRLTICLSTQVGCRFGCKFCASSKAGFVRELKTDEIAGQVLKIRNELPDKRLTNIVLMGIGEGFDNYENTLKAIRILNLKSSLNIGARRFTISTCGIVPGIERLSREGLQVELAVSLHSPEDSIRSSLMPVNKIFPINQLMAACRRFTSRTNRQVTFEYIMIEGINDRKADIVNLCKLLKGLNCKINLIPLNPIPEFRFKAPVIEKIYSFCTALNRQGIKATLRQSKGRDIDASCGQLRLLKRGFTRI